MQFSISASELKNRLSAIIKVINTKTSNPILSKFIFTLSNDRLSVKAADAEIFVISKPFLVTTTFQGMIVFALDATNLLNGLKEIPEQPVTFELSQENSAIIHYINGHFEVPVLMDVNDFPEPISLKKDCSNVEIPVDVLRKAIIGCSPFMANDDLRPIMNGICFDFLYDRVNFVSSDGHQLMRITYPWLGLTGKKFVLPRTCTKLIIEYLGKQTEAVVVSFDDRGIIFDMKEYTLYILQAVGKYPNYNSVIPINGSKNAVINRTTLISALRRVMVFSDFASSIIALNFKDANTLNLFSEDIDFSVSAEENVQVQFSGETIRIGLKSTFLLNILSALTGDEVNLELTDASKAIVLRPAFSDEKLEYLTLLMPLLLNK